MTTTASRYLRLSPSTRTRLTNTFFIFACSLSIVTVSLGMSGVGGRNLPCPARRSGNGRGEVGLEGEAEEIRFERRLRKGKGKEVEGTSSNAVVGMRIGHGVPVINITSGGWKEKSTSQRRWLDDPKPRTTNKNNSSSSWNFNPFSTPTASPSTSSRKNQLSAEDR